ncbi:hypothetical protein AAHN97_15015 [Chitinophaga niabensis]|uniref:hypothetical protein n=1 Tax=Chitinophaga niabensis TaxID=536979 RepID=UPI0031BBCA50
MLKEKILAELKKKYSGLSNEFLGFLAEKMAVKTTEESQIEGAISELEKSPISVTDLAAEFQKEGDRRATGASNKKEAELKEKYNLVEKKAEPPKPPTPPNPEPGKEGNTEIAELKTMVLELSKTLAEKDAKATKDSLFAKLKGKNPEKKIPDMFFEGKVVEKEEDIDKVYADVEAAYTAAKQHFIDLSMSESSKPLGGAGANGDQVSSLMKEYIDHEKKTEQK